MPKGGARSRSGPAPDPQALRRDKASDGEWLILDAAGRQGDPPAFPLLDQTNREGDLWSEVWALPQAIVWERDHHEHAVALYVRALGQVEKPDAPVTLLAQVRQYGESLGLTGPGMARNRWKVGTPPPTVSSSPTPAPPDPSRRRLELVADAVEREEATA